MSGVTLTRDGNVATVCLATGAAGNRVTGAHIAELRAALRAAAESGAGAVLLRGVRDFCAGRDGPPPIADRADVVQLVSESVDLLATMSALPIPTVVFVSGAADGIGASLAARGDVVVAAPDASMSFPEIEAGFVPMLALHSLSKRVTPSAALWLVATGGRIDAARALQVGLVSEVGDLDLAIDRARTLGCRSASVVRTRGFIDTLRGTALPDLAADVSDQMVDEYWHQLSARQRGSDRDSH